MTITDIVNKVYFLTKTNVTAFPAADMLILINNAYERVSSIILQSDGRWQWDDNNQTDTPFANYTITSGTQNYAIATNLLALSRVEVKDSNGAWHLLKPIDQVDVYDQSIVDFMSGGGLPQYYDKIGDEMYLYPTPNYTQASSLRFYFRRAPLLYTSAEVTTGTKVPGFNSLYHDLIPLWVSYDYAMANGLPNANQLQVEIQKKEDAIREDYALRNKDEHLTLRARRNSNFR